MKYKKPTHCKACGSTFHFRISNNHRPKNPKKVNISKNGLEREQDNNTNEMLDNTIDTSYFSSPPTSPNTKFVALESELISLSNSCKEKLEANNQFTPNFHWQYEANHPMSPIRPVQNNQCSENLNSSLTTFDYVNNKHKNTINIETRVNETNVSLMTPTNTINHMILNQISAFPDVAFGNYGLNLVSDNIDFMEVDKQNINT